MTRDFLKGLGLETEMIDSVIKEHGKGIEDFKGKLATSETTITTQKEQLTQRDKDLEVLQKSAKGNEELQGQIKELQESNGKQAEEYAKQLKLTNVKNALKLELNGRTENIDKLTSLIQLEAIELDEKGNLKDDFKAVLSEMYPATEKQTEEVKTTLKGVSPNLSTDKETKSTTDINKYLPKTQNNDAIQKYKL